MGTNVIESVAAAINDVFDGAAIAVGGFGLCGIPDALINAVAESGVGNLTVYSNNCGIDDHGLGILLQSGQIHRMVASYVGENSEFERQYLAGELEVEFTPQGTLAERLRAGLGIPAFFTPAGVGSAVADGGLPLRYAHDGSVAKESQAKETRVFEGKPHVLEPAITADFALVHALIGDTAGNLVFHKSAKNFNPLAAMAGKVTIAQVEHLVPAGEIDPDRVHLPGIFVQRVVRTGPQDKRIEKRTVSAAAGASQ